MFILLLERDPTIGSTCGQRPFEYNHERLGTSFRAAKAKWWTTEMQKRAVDHCLQLFGGYSYMCEYAIARAYEDARIQTSYAGRTEIMKDIVGRSLGLSPPTSPTDERRRGDA